MDIIERIVKLSDGQARIALYVLLGRVADEDILLLALAIAESYPK